MTTKALLLVTAALEAATGISLLTVPALVAALLLGEPLDGAAAVAFARVAGIALISLAVACWFARASKSPVTNGLVTGLLTYNAAVSMLLMESALSGIHGPGLWPAVALHLLMACWCLFRLRAA